MKVVKTRRFIRTLKRLHPNQRKDLEKAVKDVIKDPYVGQSKKGGLSEMRVYTFKMVGQLTLLGYSYNKKQIILTLMSVGSHENFYRDIQKSYFN